MTRIFFKLSKNTSRNKELSRYSNVIIMLSIIRIEYYTGDSIAILI